MYMKAKTDGIRDGSVIFWCKPSARSDVCINIWHPGFLSWMNTIVGWKPFLIKLHLDGSKWDGTTQPRNLAPACLHFNSVRLAIYFGGRDIMGRVKCVWKGKNNNKKRLNKSCGEAAALTVYKRLNAIWLLLYSYLNCFHVKTRP